MLHEKIVHRMQEIGITQAELSRRSGLRTGHVAELVHGKRGKRISAETRDKLTLALKVPNSFFSTINTHKRVNVIRKSVSKDADG